jgi:hypothetical protein
VKRIIWHFAQCAAVLIGGFVWASLFEYYNNRAASFLAVGLGIMSFLFLRSEWRRRHFKRLAQKQYSHLVEISRRLEEAKLRPQIFPLLFVYLVATRPDEAKEVFRLLTSLGCNQDILLDILVRFRHWIQTGAIQEPPERRKALLEGLASSGLLNGDFADPEKDFQALLREATRQLRIGHKTEEIYEE